MILIVDDEKTNQLIFEKILRKNSYRVQSIGNPRAALEQIATGIFDLILMDYQLPGMTGAEITSKIRKLPNQDVAKIPILAITASNKQDDIRDCLESGMNDVIEKPVNFDSLRAKLKKYLS